MCGLLYGHIDTRAPDLSIRGAAALRLGLRLKCIFLFCLFTLIGAHNSVEAQKFTTYSRPKAPRHGAQQRFTKNRPS